MCYFLNFGYNHGWDCYRLLDAETGRVAYSRDVTWHHPETPWVPPIRVAPTEPPREIYVPMSQSVPVDDIFAVGQKERCDRLCVDLNRTIPVKNLGDLKWYGGCRSSRDRKRVTLTISQQSFAEELVKKIRAASVQSVPLK